MNVWLTGRLLLLSLRWIDDPSKRTNYKTACCATKENTHPIKHSIVFKYEPMEMWLHTTATYLYAVWKYFNLLFNLGVSVVRITCSVAIYFSQCPNALPHRSTFQLDGGTFPVSVLGHFGHGDQLYDILMDSVLFFYYFIESSRDGSRWCGGPECGH